MEIDSHEFQQDRLSLPMVCCVMCGAPPSAEVHNVFHDRAKMVTPITNYDFFAGIKSAYSPTHGALLEQIADLAGILITNAELAPDMRFQWQGAVDCYHVPLNDVESLRTVLATLHKAKGAKMISEDYIREDEDAIEFQNQVAKVMVAAGAQEIDLPKSVESRLSAKQLWYTKGGSFPFSISVERALLFDMSDESGQCLFPTEKEALEEARKHAKQAEDRWRQILNAIDDRIDRLETSAP